jgi:secreted PhoX family phosphatase
MPCTACSTPGRGFLKGPVQPWPRAACEDGGGTDYSPGGDTLFVNIQTPGITFAITGPFEKGVL